MASEGIPVNKEIVAWARKRAGLTIEDATQKFPHIAAWEAGEALPTYPQLEKLADELKLPIAAFFFPEPPTLPPIRESFRTLPDTEFDQIPRQVRFLLRKAKALQLNLSELTQGRNPSARLITRDLRFRDTRSIARMAAQVRDYLGVSLSDQYRWPDDETALKAWRDTLHAAGVFVFKDAFRVEGYSGFSLYDNEFPIIYVNNSATKTRQIFTLFHELAHLLFHTSGIDTIEDRYITRLPEQQRRIEILCNQFAAEFLVPDTVFSDAMADRDHSEQTASQLAQRYHVSREVIYRKFLDRGWIDQAEYARAADEWAAQKTGGSGGNWYYTQIIYLGRDYINLAFRQYHQNRIDDAQLAEYLDTKPRNIGTLEEYFLQGSQ
ncbi:MAG TPA: ImmA/IrrE family metallo-endopeptidase [Acetobacteraceae bacterium]|nr:ImmA/IrrE family metallo-endopeptidase [Acetobacteraceae bacterium]